MGHIDLFARSFIYSFKLNSLFPCQFLDTGVGWLLSGFV